MSRIFHLSRWTVALLALLLASVATPGMVCTDMADCAMEGMMYGCGTTALATDHCDTPPSSVAADCCQSAASPTPAVAADGSSVPAPSDAATPPGSGDEPGLRAVWSAASGSDLPNDAARPSGRTLLALHQTFLS